MSNSGSNTYVNYRAESDNAHVESTGPIPWVSLLNTCLSRRTRSHPLLQFVAEAKLEKYRVAQVFDGRVYQDGGYSIWFSVRDMFALPNLIKGLTLSVIQMSRVRRYAPPRSTLGNIASTSLGVQFGVLPTIAGVQDFIRTVHSFRRFLEDMKNGREIFRRFRHPSVVLEPYPEYLGEFSYQGVQFRVMAETKITVNHGLYYALRCPDMVSWLSRLFQIVDRFGVADPSAVWDLIPFTFLVDWFLPISKWLSNNRPRFSNIDLISPGASMSYKEESDYRVSLVSVPGSTGVSNLSVSSLYDVPLVLESSIGDILTSGKITRYYRCAAMPIFNVSAMSTRYKGLSLRQRAIAGTLAAQKLSFRSVEKSLRFGY